MGLFQGNGDAAGVVAGVAFKRVGLTGVDNGAAIEPRGGPLGIPIAKGWLGNICCEPG